MNKELILKYKTEFDHWLNGGKLQVKFVNDPWEEAPEDIFSYSTVNFVLVVDDEYVEFRKALAEGKTIQYLSEDSKDWKDCTNQTSPSRQFLVHPTKYRIKPEEPKFKVGDWVRVKTDTFEYDGTARISKGVKRLSKSDMWLFSENHYKCNPDNYTEHWQPKVGELFWGTRTLHLDYQYKTRIELFKIKNVHDDGTLSLISPLDKNVYSLWIQPEDLQEFMKTAEPFIGQLPTILKD